MPFDKNRETVYNDNNLFQGEPDMTCMSAHKGIFFTYYYYFFTKKR